MTRQEKLELVQKKHLSDADQMEFLNCDDSSVITAPAGCGKTESLISKIELLLLKNQVPYSKKILILTLSNVAKYTIERRLKQKIPNFRDYVTIHNFYTFSTHFYNFHRNI